ERRRHPRARRRRPHRAVGAQPGVRRAARRGEVRGPLGAVTAADRRVPRRQPAGRGVHQEGQARGRHRRAGEVVPYEERLRVVVRGRPAVQAHLDDPGHRLHPAGRPASRRLAAAVSTAEQTRGTRGRGRAAPPRRAVPRSRARTVRTPTVLQMEAVECGAASLAMVLGHYGRHVPLEELRIACGVSRDGSRASNLLKAARSYGLTAKGMQMDTAALAEVQGPAILFWEFNHYVVYDGMGRRFGRRGVYINDPGKGRRFVPLEDFDGSFTGVVLVMEPGKDFKKGGRKPGVLGAMPARLRGTAGTMPAV